MPDTIEQEQFPIGGDRSLACHFVQIPPDQFPRRDRSNLPVARGRVDSRDFNGLIGSMLHEFFAKFFLLLATDLDTCSETRKSITRETSVENNARDF